MLKKETREAMRFGGGNRAFTLHPALHGVSPVFLKAEKIVGGGGSRSDKQAVKDNNRQANRSLRLTLRAGNPHTSEMELRKMTQWNDIADGEVTTDQLQGILGGMESR